MLVEQDLFGNVRDKVKVAVEIARMFEPKNEPYIMADSGGKDSRVVRRILDMAGVRYEAHYNVTTVDPPELVRFLIGLHEAVIYDMPDGSHKYFTVHRTGKLLRPSTSDEMTWKNTIHFNIPEMTMRELIVHKQAPPLRTQRYCCEWLKESSNEGRITVTGVRRHESANRKKNQGVVAVFDKKTARSIKKENNIQFKETTLGGVILNYDDSESRRTVENCYRTGKIIVNPILDFTEEDVWEFIKKYDVPYCPLYDEGFRRLGCIGCPIASTASQIKEFERWPQYKRLYTRAFDEMLKAREKAGKCNRNPLWTDGEGVMRWWLGYGAKNIPGQIEIDDFQAVFGGRENGRNRVCGGR